MMMTLLRVACMLLSGLIATSALAAGGTSSAPSPNVSLAKPVKPKPKKVAKAPASTAKPVTKKAGTVAKTAVAKKAAPAQQPVAPVITDDWATKFGDLGPAYISAVKLAKAEKYDAAIKAFNTLSKPDDPRVNNWIGYSLRKQGKVDQALPFYEKALAKAPDYTPAHEYLGEAYIQMKDAARAKEQLAQIEKLCGNKTCEEYQDLSEALAKAAL